MTEKQILGLQPAPRLEQVDDEYSECVEDRKHRSQWCDESALRCEPMSDGIFGKDKEIVQLSTAETAEIPPHEMDA
jgi:hypothetical protein